jgi:hypothetical protein
MVPFASRWEVTSYLWSQGSFVEAGKVRPLTTDVASGASGELWVERIHPAVAPAQRMRVLRRWSLATRLMSRRWPRLVDMGEDAGRAWAVLEAPGQRPEGTFPNVRVEQGLKEVRGLALAMAEAEALLEASFCRPALAVRPAVLARSPTGRLMLHLAALDREPDEGFPTPVEWRLFTPEELLGHPATARTNAFVLGWLLCLVLTGRPPYEPTPAAGDQVALLTRESLGPLILGGRLRSLGLAEALKPAEAIIRRALSPMPGARFANSAAFAEAMAELTPMAEETWPPGPRLPVPALDWPVTEEQLPAALENELARKPDAIGDWLELAQRFDDAHGGRSTRAALLRAHHTVDSRTSSAREKAEARASLARLLEAPGVTPALASEKLGLGWQLGYVRMLAVRPEGELPPTAEAHVAALVGLLQHPSLRFVQLLSLNGSLPHAHRWVQALQRLPPPALRRVHITAVPASDPFAIDVAYRFPRWTWTWGKAKRGSLWTRLFSREPD